MTVLLVVALVVSLAVSAVAFSALPMLAMQATAAGWAERHGEVAALNRTFWRLFGVCAAGLALTRALFWALQ